MADTAENPSDVRGHYLLFCLLSLLLLCGLVAGFNAAVDPQARLLWVEQPGFNEAKVGLMTNSRKGKASALRQCNYDAIILGTSRAETAIPVSHPALAGAEVYNAALRAGTAYEMRRMAEYALEHQRLKVVLLSLDFESFSSAIVFAEDFPESPLAETVAPAAMARYLFSLQTFGQSVATLVQNRRGNVSLCSDNGEFKRTYEIEPARGAFDFILRRYASGHYGKYVAGELHIRHLQRLLQVLAANNVEVYAFISPFHATELELMTEMGLLDDYDNWRRNLVRVFADVNDENPGQPAAVLWDFSGYNAITTEKVPSPDREKFMRWYTDPSHFTKEVGTLMLDRMFDVRPTETVVESPFGVKLTSANVEAVIKVGRVASEHYREQNPDEISRIQEMLRETKPELRLAAGD